MPVLRRRARLHQTLEGSHHCRQRPPDRREDLIILPAAAQRFVQAHEISSRALLRQNVLLLDLVFLPLRVDDVERIRQTALEAFGGQC